MATGMRKNVPSEKNKLEKQASETYLGTLAAVELFRCQFSVHWQCIVRHTNELQLEVGLDYDDIQGRVKLIYHVEIQSPRVQDRLKRVNH